MLIDIYLFNVFFAIL